MARFLPTKRDIISQVFSFLLGVAISASPVYAAIFLATVVLLYLLVVFALPFVSPEDLLEQARNQISDTRVWLDDEAATRHSVDMYAISVRGYQCLQRVEQHINVLLAQHTTYYTLRNVARYVAALPALVIAARRCQSDIMALRSDLEEEVGQLRDN